jgi:RNA polymerase sigma-70 factor (ECF subfamily)
VAARTEPIARLSLSASLTDEEVVARVLDGDVASFEILMRRHNQRLYRIGRAILRNDAEAEDVMQDAYVRAYEHLKQFQGKAKFSTWLSRIAVNEALARRKSFAREEALEPMADESQDSARRSTPRLDQRFDGRFQAAGRSPEHEASDAEVRGILENAIGSLPDDYRTVIMLRDIEEMDTAETAATLNISEENVKTRLHRARAMLRKKLYLRVGGEKAEAFAFHAVRCDRVVKNVMERISKQISA